jgi:penicillin-binding protein 2
MARRKRMVYDPPHLRAGRKGKRPGAPRRPDQIFMTRRMFLARGIVVAAFTTLAAKLGYMQVAERRQYQALAIDNITRSEVLKATRGGIYDRKNRELAINERTWEVRVLPADLPEEGSPGRIRVLDQLVNALHLPDALVLDPNSVPVGQEETVYARTAQLLGKVLAVERSDATAQLPVLGTAGQVIKVNGQDLQVFLYVNEMARKADSVKIAAEGEVVAGQKVSWSAPPHFFSQANVLALLVGGDDRLVSRVARAIDSLSEGATLDGVATTLRQDGFAAWKAYIDQQEKINYLVNLEDDLTTDLAALCRAHLNELPGVKVMNRLEYLVANGMSAERVVVQRSVPREVALKLEANKLSLPGVELDGDVMTRRYPGGEAMSHILGYVGTVSEADRKDPKNESAAGSPRYQLDDMIGKDGLERTQEDLLRGTPGLRTIEMTPAGGLGRVIPGSEVDPVPGKNLSLTIDLELQRAVSEILRDGIAFSNADRQAIAAADPTRPLKKESGAGCVVAIDPRNGDVLAMVSFPHYDNQLFVNGISQRKYTEYVSDEANKPLFDRALRGSYPAGSTLKPFHAAAALHEKKLDVKKTYSCVGAILVPLEWDESKGNTYPCWKWKSNGHGALDVFGAIEQSCDVFFYNVGAPRQPLADGTGFLHYRDRNLVNNQIDQAPHYFEGLGIELIKENLEKRFWFGQPTGIDLPTEAPGVVPDQSWLAKTHPDQNWSAGATINVSIGQGFFETTPLQLALNTAALGNRGTIYKPQLRHGIFDDLREGVRLTKSEILRTLDLEPGVFDVVREGMRRVVHSPAGTAHQNLDQSTKWPLTNPRGEPEILIGGKTGTAELGDQDAQGNYERQHAWFTLFAPLEKPEIAISVIIEDGGEGSSYAVPVADRVLRAYFETTGRRARGKVLRPEGMPATGDASVLAPSAVFPTPGSMSSPGSQRQD